MTVEHSNSNKTLAPRMVLASASPRRRELLEEHGYCFTVIVPTIDEPKWDRPDVSPTEFAESISFFKAKSVACEIRDGLILGADTVVALNGQIYGKPADRDDAKRILSTLGGTTHEVITGVTLLDAASGRRLIQHDTTKVTMRRMSPPELEAYLDSGQWQGKAGAYGIQDRVDEFVTSFDGSFTNVVGLPMELLTRMLEEWGGS